MLISGIFRRRDGGETWRWWEGKCRGFIRFKFIVRRSTTFASARTMIDTSCFTTNRSMMTSRVSFLVHHYRFITFVCKGTFVSQKLGHGHCWCRGSRWCFSVFSWWHSLVVHVVLILQILYVAFVTLVTSWRRLRYSRASSAG